MSGRPFVDERVLDVARTTRLARATAREWQLPEPELHRVGMNAIYVAGDVVLRVGRATAPATSAHRLAGAMRAAGVPVAAPISGAAKDAESFAITAWERLRSAARPVDWREVGAAVRRIHQLDPAQLPPEYPVPSPTTFPWWRFDELLAEVAAHIDPAARRGLRAAIDSGRSWALDVAGDAVVCHGDVHPGNVMMTVDGPVLIDFDLMCRAAPAWDHAMLTSYAARWGGDAAAYPHFASGYGRSLADDPLTQTIASLRNVAATLMRVRAGLGDEAARDEAQRRLRFWRGDPDAPAWRAQ